MRLGPEYKGVCLSSDTLVPDHIFSNIKHLLPQDLINLYMECQTEEEKSQVLNGEIYWYLNEIAPEGCYFGTHPGDGACFGFWEEEEE